MVNISQELWLRRYHAFRPSFREMALKDDCIKSEPAILFIQGDRIPIAEVNAFRNEWYAGVPLDKWADHWGISRMAVSKIAKRLGLPTRRHHHKLELPMELSPKAKNYFRQEAGKRNLKQNELFEMILEAIAKDKIVNAVLDDNDGLVG